MATCARPRWLPNGWVDGWFIWIALPLILATYVIPKVLMHESGFTEDMDTGIYTNLAWAVWRGEGFSGSVLGRHHLGEHFSPIMALVGLLYLVLPPTTQTLMVLHGLLVGGSVALTLAALRRGLIAADVTRDRLGMLAGVWRVGASLTLLAMLLMWPPLLGTFSRSFQPIIIGLPLVILSVWAIDARRDWALAMLVALLLATRESAALSVIGLGLYAMLYPRRPWLGVGLILAGCAWAGLVFSVLMPSFRAGETWQHSGYFGPTTGWDEATGYLKPRYLVVLVAGLGLLPLVGWRAVALTAAAVPGVMLNLAVDRPAQVQFHNHYDAQIAPFLMLAAAAGIVDLSRLLLSRAVRQSLNSAWLHRGLAAVVALALGLRSAFEAFHYMHLVGQRAPYEWATLWWPTPERRAQVLAVREAGARLRDAPALAAHGRLGPQVANRPRYMTLRLRIGRDGMTWSEWAHQRLLPGTAILLPGPASTDYSQWLDHSLRDDGRSQLESESDLLLVFRWPDDAPPPGTPEAWEYIVEGQRRADARR